MQDWGEGEATPLNQIPESTREASYFEEIEQIFSSNGVKSLLDVKLEQKAWFLDIVQYFCHIFLT
jgi:hypothetical protein